MSNRAKREKLVPYGRDARVEGSDPLRARQFWFPNGIIRAAIDSSKEDTECHDNLHFHRTSAQWFKELRTWQ